MKRRDFLTVTGAGILGAGVLGTKVGTTASKGPPVSAESKFALNTVRLDAVFPGEPVALESLHKMLEGTRVKMVDGPYDGETGVFQIYPNWSLDPATSPSLAVVFDTPVPSPRGLSRTIAVNAHVVTQHPDTYGRICLLGSSRPIYLV